MNKHTYRYWLLTALALAALLQVVHAQIIVQHIGANDPRTEGFVRTNFVGKTEVGPVFDDFGRDAWMIKLTSVSDHVYYTHYLTPQQTAEAMTYGWELSVTVRFLAMPPSTALNFQTGNEGFTMDFRSGPAGELAVIDRRGTYYFVEDHQGGYHNYRFVYDPLLELAILWVDGVDTGVGFRSSSVSGERSLWLAAGESREGTQAHWHEITLTIIPEPATVALLSGLGALLLAGVVRRRRRASFGP
jgi:hypothetical protein